MSWGTGTFGSLKEPEKRGWNKLLDRGQVAYNDSAINILHSTPTDDIRRYLEKYLLRSNELGLKIPSPNLGSNPSP